MNGRNQSCNPAGRVVFSLSGHNITAHVAELVDALDSGSSRGNPVEVRVLSCAPL
jgi:hypothetical protein